MNYESTPLCTATANPTSAKGMVVPPLPEQMKYCQESTNRLCEEVSKLMYFACVREVEPPALEDTSLSALLAWMHNTMMRCTDALCDVNRRMQ